MNNSLWVRWLCATMLVAAIAVLDIGCKKDESPTSPGGGGLPTFSFATSGQTFTVPASGGAARAVLTGGTLPYTITSAPSASVATASLTYDTLTVTPVGPGSTSISITDSLGMLQDRVVTLNITVTGTSGGGNFGSGTVTVNSSVGNRSYTGTGVFPIGAGPSVIAVYDTISHGLFMLGYRQISGSHYDYALLSIFMPQGVTAGTYGGDTVGFEAGYNIDTTHTDSLSYSGVSGTITVSTVSGNTASGSYAGQATQLSSGSTANFNGTFNVTYVRGIEPVTGGGTAGNIPINVGLGTHPQYSWTGGAVRSVTVVRTADPGTPVWYVVCTSGDCINSPVTHGTTPSGATALVSTELTLTAGVQYRVIVLRTNNDFGTSDFTP